VAIVPVLRISKASASTVTLEFLEEGQPLFGVSVPMPDLTLSPRDHGEIRWYLEDFREFPQEPAPAVAARCASRLRELGEELFTALFGGTAEARALWGALSRRGLDAIQVEIDVDLDDMVPVPFELLRDPDSDTVLALAAQSFAYVHRESAVVAGTAGPLRVLLVICRPGLDIDVPFRSVASRVLALGERYPDLSVEVLRPPTFARLRTVLAEAAGRGEPFHLVHFDGHGVFGSEPGAPAQGYVLFEQPDEPGNQLPVDGGSLGQVLVAAGVSTLVLNACGSARTLPAWQIESDGAEDGQAARAYGSLARNALLAGLTGVVAMRYDLYVGTAALFVSGFYRSLLATGDLARAVTDGRVELFGLGWQYWQVPQHDWLVPAVYVRPPGPFLPRTGGKAEPLTDVPLAVRDDLTITLDRAFDRVPLVVLHGPVGIGKSSAAGDFAHWYRLTGGVPGQVDAVSLARDDAQRLLAAPAEGSLWVVDDGHMVQDWAQEDRLRLAEKLHTAVTAGAKVLVVSRDEAEWAGPAAERIAVRPLNFLERRELARALAPEASPAELAPVLAASLGNPLALRVMLDPGQPVPELSGELLRSRFTAPELRVLGLLLELRTNVSVLHLTRLARRAGLAELDYDDTRALLGRAAALGVLARRPGDFFEIHPLLAGWLRPVLASWPDAETREQLLRAVAREFSGYSQGIFWGFTEGKEEALDLAAYEEDNLLLARNLALRCGLVEDALSPMQALRPLYVRRGQAGQWSKLVSELSPVMVSPESGRPREDLGFSDPASLDVLLSYLEDEAETKGDHEEAVALRALTVRHLEEASGDTANTSALRSLAIKLGSKPSAEKDLIRAIDLAHQAGDTGLEASLLISLGHWSLDRGGGQREQSAMEFFQESLLIAANRHPREAMRALEGLGTAELQRVNRLTAEHGQRLYESGQLAEGLVTVPLPEEAVSSLLRARDYYQAALQVGVEDARVGALYHQYAGVCGTIGDLEQAQLAYQRAIAWHIRAGDRLKAAQSRADLGFLFGKVQRLEDARVYLNRALADLDALGLPGTELAAQIRRYLAELPG
jgi:tetratricopeptide (TPR) repeat protein